ncbi:MAG TPA: hypothetical protein VGK71_09935 [Nitrospirota bacterium]
MNIYGIVPAVRVSAFSILLAMLVLAAGCRINEPAGQAGTQEGSGNPVIALVDGEPITKDDLATAGMSLDARGGSLIGSAQEQERLDLVIERKALIHEAMKLKLHKDPEFVSAISKYWEHTLLSKMLDRRRREIEKELTVSDEEIAAFSEMMLYRFKYSERSFGSREEAESEAARPDSREKGRVFEIIGCDGLGPKLAGRLLALSPGKAFASGREGRFVVSRLQYKKKDISKSELPPPEEIKKILVAAKRSEAMDEWVSSVVGRAAVMKQAGKEGGI